MNEANKELRFAIVCTPVAWNPEPENVVSGSVHADCEHCGCSVWVSPKGQTIRATRDGAEYTCTPCGMLLMMTQNVESVQPIAEASGSSFDEDEKRRLL